MLAYQPHSVSSYLVLFSYYVYYLTNIYRRIWNVAAITVLVSELEMREEKHKAGTSGISYVEMGWEAVQAV